MSRLYVSLAAAVLCTSVLLVPAVAEPGAEGPEGRPCEYVALPHSDDDGTQAGKLTAGPLQGDGTVRCAIQVGMGVHSAPDTAAAEAAGSDVVVLPPTFVEHARPGRGPMFLCTSWHPSDGGPTLYLYRGTKGESWSFNPNTRCDALPAPSLGDVEEIVAGIIGTPQPDPWGALCSATSAGSGSSESGTLDGGPLALAADNHTPMTGAMTCTVQVNGRAHHAADVCVAQSPVATGAVLAPETACGWSATADDRVYVCTAVTINGWGTLFYDDFTNEWSASSSARCQLMAVVAAPDDGPIGKDDHQARGRKGGKIKEKKKEDDDVPVAEEEELTPYFPAGVIEIKRLPTGQVEFAFRSFSPAIGEWDCTQTATSATCTPPAPPAGMVPVCGTVAVEVTSVSVGSVTGTSGCASGPQATATSNGPAAAPAADAEQANSAFAWTCSVAPGVTLAWSTRCAVGA